MVEDPAAAYEQHATAQPQPNAPCFRVAAAGAPHTAAWGLEILSGLAERDNDGSRGLEPTGRGQTYNPESRSDG